MYEIWGFSYMTFGADKVLYNVCSEVTMAKTNDEYNPKTKDAKIGDIITGRLCKQIQVELPGEGPTIMERRVVLAESIIQLLTTGEVHLPDRRDPETGELIRGKVFDYSADSWIENVTKILRYIEPPTQQVEVNDIKGVFMSKDFEPDEG